MAKEGHLVSLCLMFQFFMFVPHFANANVPAIFILGDSIVDVGTNAYLTKSIAKANYPYNGIDFQGHQATGRFSNGLNTADCLAMLMGFKRSPPPYLFLQKLGSHNRKNVFRRGANFASAGSGLLDSTGSFFGVLPLSKQIEQLVEVQGGLKSRLGQHKTNALLAKTLFCISTGSNDIFGYFLRNSTLPVDEYTDSLIKAYATHIKSLHSLGARKFGIISVSPVGCCPAQRIRNPTGECFEAANQMALTVHSKLDKLLRSLSTQLPGMKYSLGYSYKMTMNAINNAKQFGFTNVNTACCGKGRLNAEQPCTATAALCPDRRKYMFWDQYHPTQDAANQSALTLYSGSTEFVSPINFEQLVKDK